MDKIPIFDCTSGSGNPICNEVKNYIDFGQIGSHEMHKNISIGIGRVIFDLIYWGIHRASKMYGQGKIYAVIELIECNENGYTDNVLFYGNDHDSLMEAMFETVPKMIEDGKMWGTFELDFRKMAFSTFKSFGDGSQTELFAADWSISTISGEPHLLRYQ